ncbi:hypothetical protein [Cellulomonas sp. PhB143]|uniref:hypothetical protein n=1 Tax=Cellulomonas sp. PhB143 TaxID=2485186 RepID=UPI000F487BCC|nr:hypothetical protein [Cellulomonas sp. PhB143]ROS76624.1 hypothetical protein EDF32_1445 [Cellulomonas sp. PhB143]
MILRAELLRFSRSAALPSLLFIAVGLNVLSVYGTSVQMGDAASSAVSDQAQTIKLVGLGFGASLFAMIFGALSVTRDFTSRAVGRVQLLVGSSNRLLGSRATVVAPAMLAFGVLGAASAVITAWLALPGAGSRFVWSHDATVITLGIVFSTVFAGYLGQLVAWQVRRSLVAVIVLVAWTLLLETYLIQLIPSVGRFLPGGLGQAMLEDTSGTDEILSAGWGYVGYVVWLVVLSGLAVWRLRKTDLAQ